MAFHDDRLPVDVERGAVGGPRFKTQIFPRDSGHEDRNIVWERRRGEWDIGYGLTPPDVKLFDTVMNHIHARMGMAHSFPFKDWSDFEIGEDSTDTYQEIGIGDGVEVDFQIEKRYTSGGYTYAHPITKPIVSTVRVFVDGVEKFSPGDWSVVRLTGMITFVVAPLDTKPVQVICEFDKPVRYHADALDINMILYRSGQIPQIPIIEVKLD